MSLLFDTFGAFDVVKEPLTWNRIIGAVLVFASVILANVDKFKKQHLQQKK